MSEMPDSHMYDMLLIIGKVDERVKFKSNWSSTLDISNNLLMLGAF